MKLTWLDIRAAADKRAVLEEAVHQRVDGIVTDTLTDLADLPPPR